MAASRTFVRHDVPINGIEGGFAVGATRSVAVPLAGDIFYKRATIFFKIFFLFMPKKLLLKFGVLFYELGIFCLKIFDVFCQECEFRFK